MWSPENFLHDEASKIRWGTIPYFSGMVLDIGLTRHKTFPHWLSVGPNREVKLKDADDLSMFSSGSVNGVFSSFFLDKVGYDEVPTFLGEWFRVTRDGGHVMLYLPDTEHFPANADPDHLWEVSYDKLVAAMETIPGWDLVTYEQRSDGDEYGLWFVFKKLPRGHFFSHRNPKPEKTCAVVRLGAYGDLVQASSIFPWLKSQGYHTTLICSDHGYPVIKHDPHIDRFIIQGRDEIPPAFLGEFWDHEKKKYDKWVNLSESVECTLLASHDRSNFDWPESVKAKYMDRNYVEFTHELAEVPPPYKPKFYSTLQEKSWAKEKARSYGRRNILWSLSGSSVHKTWPHLDAVVARILVEYPDTHVVLVGDEVSQVLEAGWQKERRVHCRSGKWSIRESMSFAEVADLIIGTETGLLNAAGSMETPKIVTLSHSSENMLTKHWLNTIALSQPNGVGCSKQPCRQLHRDWSTCMRHEVETGTAACQAEITPLMMWAAIEQVMCQPHRMVA